MESVIITIFFFATAASFGLLFWAFFLQKKSIDLFDLIISLVIGTFMLTWFLFLTSNIIGRLSMTFNYSVLATVLLLTTLKNYKKIKIKVPTISNQNLIIAIFYGFAFTYFLIVFRKLL